MIGPGLTGYRSLVSLTVKARGLIADIFFKAYKPKLVVNFYGPLNYVLP